MVFLASASGEKCLSLQVVEYGIGTWDNEQYGNHRAVVFAAGEPEAVRVVIPWRRRDAFPERKRMVVVSERTGERIANAVPLEVTQAYGDIVFEPDTVNGYYYVYYMPYLYEAPMYCPTTVYLSPEETADPEWIEKIGLRKPNKAPMLETLPTGIVEELQAVDAFHSVYPMEVKATPEETAALAAEHSEEDFLVFCEGRENSIRMTEGVPLKWVQSGPVRTYHGRALRNEYFVFQVGVFAHRRNLENIRILFNALESDAGNIPATNITCFNTGGIDVRGERFTKKVDVSHGTVQPLWVGVQVPQSAVPGSYSGIFEVTADNTQAVTVKMELKVLDEIISNHGDGDLRRLSKLRWLNSTIGQGDHVVQALEPVRVDDHHVDLLGRSVELSDNGLPGQIHSFFADTLDRLQARPIPLLSDAISFEVTGRNIPSRVRLRDFGLRDKGKSYALYTGSGSQGSLMRDVRIQVENDGWVDCHIVLNAIEDTAIDEASLTVPIRREVARYMMGMGYRGGKRPSEWAWSWPNNQYNHMLWIGDVNAGLRIRLDYPFDYWSLNSFAPSGRPAAWYNDGKGRCELFETDDAFVLKVYTGDRVLKKGDSLDFRFSLLVTPFKTIDYDHWNWRYCHGWKDLWPVEKVLENGAKIVNIHQGNRIIPNINYVFTTAPRIKNYIENARKAGLERVKIYNTVRELSNHLPELWAFRSLGDEIYLPGAGFQLADHFEAAAGNAPGTRTGNSWLCEHLIDRYAPAWHDVLDGKWDSAIGTQGISRLHNFYLEGLSWLIKEVGIDGLYLDGIGYDRRTTRRLRTVMDSARPGCLLDFHSGDNFSKHYGYGNPANLYMEHFPYLDSLWFGEGYDYTSEPDYWLVEISGLPFGLFGEMLQGGGNPWRGMIYGMSNRLRWQGNPKPIWALWDLFGIDQSRMYGYWSQSVPVRTGREDVLTTVYARKDSALVVLASWAKKVEHCTLEINWQQLGFDKDNFIFEAPALDNLQEQVLFKADSPIPVVPEQGWFLILRRQKPDDDLTLLRDFHFENKDWYRGLTQAFHEDFSSGISADWTRHLSGKVDVVMEIREGRLGISAPANTYAYLSRPLLPGTQIVEGRLARGTDMGATWGPGVALAWPQVDIRLHLRSDGQFCIDDGSHFDFCGMVSTDGSMEYYVRVILEQNDILFQSSWDGEYYQTLRKVSRPSPEPPRSLLIGKMGIPARDTDYTDPGPVGTCYLDEVKIFIRE